MVECRIPGHITGLYIFAVVNLCALLNISLVSAEVYVINTERNVTLVEMRDDQAMFGPDFPEDGLVGRLVYVTPHDACSSVDPPPKFGEIDMPWIALVSRGPCHFDKKVFNVQKAGFAAAIVHNYKDNDSIMPMAGDQEYEHKINIPSVFVGYMDGMKLAHHFNYTSQSALVKIREFSYDNLTSYFWPFTIVVSACFLGVLIFSIVKAIRFFRERRRSRLSKRALKKLPTRKFKKGDYFDVCAICLEDYEEGEKLRVLPCDHTYHCKCIDPWLTKRKRTCPQCKRRVIPGHETDSDSDNEGEGGDASATENTPLLSNNNAGRSSRPPRVQGPRAATGSTELPATVRTEVEVGEPAEGQQGEDDSDSDEDLEGAVGGVGISDVKDFEAEETDVIVDVEPVQTSQDTDLQPSDSGLEPETLTDSATEVLMSDERLSPARVEGSINAAFNSSTTSNSSEDDGTGSSTQKSRKKSRRGNQVV